MTVYTIVTIDKDRTIDLYHYNDYFNAIECFESYLDLCEENNEKIIDFQIYDNDMRYFRTDANYECFIRKERMLDIE